MSTTTIPKPKEETQGLQVQATDADNSLPATEVESYTGDSEIALPAPPRGVTAPVTKDDLILPTLRIAHKSGVLGDQFQHGSYVLDGQQQITQFHQEVNGSTQLEVTILEAQKSYVQNVPYGSGIPPEILFDDEEVTAKGKTYNYWKDDNGVNQQPHYWPTLQCRVLVKRPTAKIGDEKKEVPTTLFPLSFDGENYAMLAWQLQRSGYSRAGRRILTAIQHKIFECLMCGRFMLSTTTSTMNGNKVFVPELSYGAVHSDDFVEWCARLVG